MGSEYAGLDVAWVRRLTGADGRHGATVRKYAEGREDGRLERWSFPHVDASDVCQ